MTSNFPFLSPEQNATVDAIVAKAKATLDLPVDKKGIRTLSDNDLNTMGAYDHHQALRDIIGKYPATPGRGCTSADWEAYTAATKTVADRHHAIVHAFDDLWAAMRGTPDAPWARNRAINNEVTRRKRNATVAQSKTELAGAVAPSDTFKVGEPVEVKAFGHWYGGTVKSFNKNGRAVVTYTTGTGVTRDKTVSFDLLRKVKTAA